MPVSSNLASSDTLCEAVGQDRGGGQFLVSIPFVLPSQSDDLIEKIDSFEIAASTKSNALFFHSSDMPSMLIRLAEPKAQRQARASTFTIPFSLTPPLTSLPA